MGVRRILVVFDKSPYGSISLVEGIRLATGVTAADVESVVLFMDDGVFALVENQDSSSLGFPPTEGNLEFLSVNGIQINVLQESLISRGIPAKNLRKLTNMKVINLTELAIILLQFDAIFSI
ncbi:MAG: DsrE-like protein [Promethearchaeota archaeon CR_4]|nr:MAG: DsrE-like protein [Candidatus Lokiarchaeota archaeon CR_4]